MSSGPALSWLSSGDFTYYGNTGQPIRVSQDPLVRSTFNNLVRFSIQGPAPQASSVSSKPLWERDGIAMGRQVLGLDECSRPFGYELRADASAWSYVSNQPNPFSPVIMGRGWESGVDVSPENEERFNRSLLSIGVPRTAGTLRAALSSVIDNPPLVDLIVQKVIDELRQWVNGELASNEAGSALNLFNIMDKAYRLLEAHFGSEELSLDRAEDKEAKELSLALFREDISSLVLIASTDATWKTKRWMSVGNNKLGAGLGEKAGSRWGINYGWTNLDPYMDDKNILAERLGWWIQSVSKVADDSEQITAGVRELLKTAPTPEITAAIEDLSVSDPSSRLPLVARTQERILGFIDGLVSSDAKENQRARDALADYLISLSNNLSNLNSSTDSREQLLAHVALGSMRVIVLGSMLPPVISCSYRVEEGGSTVRPNPFNRRTEISATLLISGPDPANKLRSRVFSRWMSRELQKLNAGQFDVGQLAYNKAKKAYEVTLTSSFSPDWTNYLGGVRQIRVPAYLYGYSPNPNEVREAYHTPMAEPPALLPSRQPLPATSSTQPPSSLSQVVWEWRGNPQFFFSSSDTRTVTTPWEERNFLQVPRTETNYPLSLRANLSLYSSLSPRYGGSAGRPYDWFFSDYYHRSSDTQYVVRDAFGYYFGSPALYHEPYVSSYLVQRLPTFGQVGQFLKNQPLWPRNPASVSEVSRAADLTFANASKTFILTGRPDLAGLPGPFPYDPLVQPDYSSLQLSQFSMSMREAWRAYYHIGANNYALSRTTGPLLRDGLQKDSGKWAQYAAQALLYEFLPNEFGYKALAIASDFLGKDAFNALREQATLVGEWKTPSKSANEHQVELFLGYHPGMQAKVGAADPARISNPLVLPIAGLDAKLWDVYDVAAHYAWTHRLGENWSTKVNFGIGAIISGGGMNTEIGNYMRNGYSFAFQERDMPVLPLFELNGQLRCIGRLSELSSFSSTWTFEPNYWHYYQMAKGLYGAASMVDRLFGGTMAPSLDIALERMGIDYSRLYTPNSYPLNDAPLSANALAAEFSSRGVQLDAGQAQLLQNPGNDVLVRSKNDAGIYRISRNKDGTYNIYNEYDFSNPAFASLWPLTRQQLDFMTTIPLR
ncbi:MAG: hypothetical protein M1530_04215, partial [Candidatus Marsarchaeota archaeon]|nr:hypothetical protein [Candidatus Marsarchaeota archaeon]